MNDLLKAVSSGIVVAAIIAVYRLALRLDLADKDFQKRHVSFVLMREMAGIHLPADC